MGLIQERAFICLHCGGDVELNEDGLLGTCKFCGKHYRFKSTLSDQSQIDFSLATEYWKTFRFADAKRKFHDVINNNKTFSEAYFGAFLSEYGIEWGINRFGDQVPTCHRAHTISVYENEDYKMALVYADEEGREDYKKLGDSIEEIREEILKASTSESPYDIFICFKATEVNDERKKTMDFYLGKEIYDEFTSLGYKVFFSPDTLLRVKEQDFEPYIYRALSTARVMILLCSDIEEIESPWVKNEWERFQDMHDGLGLIPLCGNNYEKFSPNALPLELRKLNAIEYDGHVFSNLRTKVESYFPEILEKKKEMAAKELEKERKEQEEENKRKQEELTQKMEFLQAELEKRNAKEKEEATQNKKNSYLKRVVMFLEDGDFSGANTYAEKVLDIDPENPYAYVGKLMAELKVKKKNELGTVAVSFDENPNYKRAISYADAKLKQELEGYAKTAKENAKAAPKSSLDDAAQQIKNAFTSVKSAFVGKQTGQEKYEWEIESKKRRKEEVYNLGIYRMKSGTIEGYREAIDQFTKVIDFKDARDQIKICNRKIAELEQKNKYKGEAPKHTVKIGNKRGHTTWLILLALFVPFAFIVIGIVHVKKYIIYSTAKSYFEKNRYADALREFRRIGDFLDSKSYIAECKQYLK